MSVTLIPTSQGIIAAAPLLSDRSTIPVISIAPASQTTAGIVQVDSQTIVADAAGVISATGAFNSLSLKSGTNMSIGSGALVAGALTVANTSVAAASLIFLQDSAGGSGKGILSITAKTPGVGFSVASTNASDTTTFDYLIVNGF
jgi:hypothetical protein